MMLVFLTLFITINQSFVRSASLNSVFGFVDDAVSKVCTGSRCTDSLDQVQDTNVPLSHIPGQYAINRVNGINPLIQSGDIQSLKQILANIDNADWSSQISFAATRQRPDMVVELAKHGDQKSLLTAFHKMCTTMGNPPGFLGLLLKETKHVPGSNDVQVRIYDAIIKGLGDPRQKFDMIHAFISNADNAQAKKSLVEALSLSDKEMLLLSRASQGDEDTVRLLAESRDKLPPTTDKRWRDTPLSITDNRLYEALKPFARAGSWDFILSLSKYRAEPIANAIILYAPQQIRVNVFNDLLANMYPHALVPVFKIVAKSGDLGIMPLVLEKLKNQIKAGGWWIKRELLIISSKPDRNYNFNISPKDWILMEGIRYASYAGKNSMVQSLRSELDNGALAQRYLSIL
jgi:hypothetical protein